MYKLAFSLFSLLLFASCVSSQDNKSDSKTQVPETYKLQDGQASAYLASGCFWCVEEIFEAVVGVDEVISGYAGGSAANANYSKVSAGSTKHAEAVQIIYRPDVIDYNELLNVFFLSHDPTTLNRQGPDRGPQYRSAIFYANADEKKAAKEIIDKLTESKAFDKPITTEVSALDVFYPAEKYHQDYVARNPSNGYVVNVSQPRFKRFLKVYDGKLKDAH